MPATRQNVSVHDMATHDPITVFVLQEFRLRAADDAAAAARIVAASSPGIEPAIPLLTSIEDRRDVATLRGLHLGETTETDPIERASLDHLVASWAAPKHYGPRIAERSQSSPSSYHLAVTESGINAGSSPLSPLGAGSDQTTGQAVGLVWIGEPIGTHAGLLVLIGSYDEDQTTEGGPSGWPLPMSRQLGVRIYETNRA